MVDRTVTPNVANHAMQITRARDGGQLPENLVRALSHVSTRTNAWIALDAAVTGVAAGIVTAAPTTLVFHLAGWPTRWALVAGAVVAVAIGCVRARARWVDDVTAASILDTLLGAKDRFLSALHFSVAADRSTLHDLQIQEAATFLHRFAATPNPPRPPLQSARILGLAAAVALASLLVARLPSAIAHLHLLSHSTSTTEHTPSDANQSLAARAAALREALHESSSRRIDAQINALARALHEQAARAEAERAHAIEQAALALDRAHRDDVIAALRTNRENARAVGQPDDATDESPTLEAARESLLQAQREREAAEHAEAPIRNDLQRSESQLAAAQNSGNSEDAQRWSQRRDELRAEMARAEAQHQELAGNERAARDALTQQQQQAAATSQQNGHPSESANAGQQQQQQQQQTAADQQAGHSSDGAHAGPATQQHTANLDEATSHLDRALQAIQNANRSQGVPSARTGEALDQAGNAVQPQMRDTAQALHDASSARQANDAQRVDQALSRARSSLSREAHNDPENVRQMREQLSNLQDQAAQSSGQLSQDQSGQSQGNSQNQQGGQSGRNTESEQRELQNGQQGESGEGSQLENGNGENGSMQTGAHEQQSTGSNGEQNQGEASSGASAEASAAAGNAGQDQQGGQMPGGAMMGQPTSSGGMSAGAMAQGMTPGAAMGGPMGPAMQGAPTGHGGSAGNMAQGNAPTGSGIGNDMGSSHGVGLSQGNRSLNLNQSGAQTVSQFDRGQGTTEANGRNQMAADGPGQAHGSTGSQGGGRAPGDPSPSESGGGHAWGTGSGGSLIEAPPTATGPLGHDVDPGGHPAALAQMASDARGWMAPGTATRGVPNGPTVQSPIAPGSLLPNVGGDGVLTRALDEDPEHTMATQRVPPSLRAYVRRYFQGIDTGSDNVHGRTP